MQKFEAKNNIEKEIRDHLNQFQVPDLVADFLLKRFESEVLSEEESNTLASFLMACGFYASLTDFFTRKLSDGSYIPWGHLAEALFRSVVGLPVEFKKALFESAKKMNQLAELSRTYKLDHWDESIAQTRVQKQLAAKQQARSLRDELIGQKEMLESQGLFEDEEKLLLRLQKIFPKDETFARMYQEFKNRRALDFIADSPAIRLERSQKEDEAIERLSAEDLKQLSETLASAREILETQPELRDDLAVALLMTGHTEGAAEIVQGSSNFWLRIEILFRARKFLEVLEILSQFEAQTKGQPELTYACLYMRAQALWGLKQKTQALEIMEGLYEVVPDYRVVSHWIQTWKEYRS